MKDFVDNDADNIYCNYEDEKSYCELLEMSLKNSIMFVFSENHLENIEKQLKDMSDVECIETSFQNMKLLKYKNLHKDESVLIIGDTLNENSNSVKRLRNLYNMYEFSDSIMLVSADNSKYPTIFNYVNTGLITMEEAIEALLK